MDDDRPPVVMPPVRRDPTIGLRRDHAPVNAPRVDDEGRELSPRALRAYQGGYRFGSVLGTVAAALVVGVAGVIGILVLVFIAHVIWHAIMIGWTIG